MTIKMRGFDSDLEVVIKRKKFMTLKEIQNYIFEKFTPTAIIKEVIHHERKNK